MIDARKRHAAGVFAFVALAALLGIGPALAQPAAASAPAAAPARTWAIVSLIGDEFSVVSRRAEVGTRLDPNERTALPVPDPVFDRIAAEQVEQLVLRARPGTPVLRALIRDPRLFGLQDKLWTESAESHDMRIALRDTLVKAGATDLLLVTKHRGTPSFAITTGRFSRPGSISGIGFYIDTETTLYRSSTKLGGEGFLAPYAYLAISSIDLATMRVVKTRYALETMTRMPAEIGVTSHAWDALTGKQKVDALDHVIRRAVATGMAEMTVE